MFFPPVQIGLAGKISTFRFSELRNYMTVKARLPSAPEANPEFQTMSTIGSIAEQDFESSSKPLYLRYFHIFDNDGNLIEFGQSLE